MKLQGTIKHLKNAPQTEETVSCCFCKNTYNTVLEAISKQATCCSRRFTGWCRSTLSYKQHLQLYLEKEIKPKFFVSKYANIVIFLFKTITRLKLALVGLDQSSHAKLHVRCSLTGTSSKAQSKPTLGAEAESGCAWEKSPMLSVSKQRTNVHSCFSHLVLLKAFTGNTRQNTGVSAKKCRWFQRGQKFQAPTSFFSLLSGCSLLSCRRVSNSTTEWISVQLNSHC